MTTPSEKICSFPSCNRKADFYLHHDKSQPMYHSFTPFPESPEPKEEVCPKCGLSCPELQFHEVGGDFCGNATPSKKPEEAKEAEFICCELVHLDIYERAFAAGLSTQSKKVEALVRVTQDLIYYSHKFSSKDVRWRGVLERAELALSELQEGEGKG